MKIIDPCECVLLPSEVLDVLDCNLIKEVDESTTEPIRRKALLHSRVAEYLKDSGSQALTEYLLNLNLSEKTIAQILINQRLVASKAGPVYLNLMLNEEISDDVIEEICKISNSNFKK